MQVPQGKATVPLLPAHLRCTHLPLKCPQGDRPQDEARQSGASTVEDRAASSSWGLLAPAASPYTDAAIVAYITTIEIQAAVSMFKSGPSSKWNTQHTHTVIVLQFHFVQAQYVYMYMYFVSIVGAVIGPYCILPYLCCVGSHFTHLSHLGFILGYTILTRTSNCLSLS